MTGTPQRAVFYVGTSASVRETLKEILVSRGIRMRISESVEDFGERSARKDCALLMVELDGGATGGLQSLTRLIRQHPQTPLLALVDRGAVALAVQAIKAGANNCIEKPIEVEQLVSAMDELLDQADPQTGHSRLPLTPVEITVLRHIVQGKTSKQIADALYRSPRTIEVHRSHIMRKLHASTIVDLVRAARSMGLLGASDQPPPGAAEAYRGLRARP